MYKILLLIIFLFVGCIKELSEYDLLHKSNPIGKYGGKIIIGDIEEEELYEGVDFLQYEAKGKHVTLERCDG